MSTKNTLSDESIQTKVISKKKLLKGAFLSTAASALILGAGIAHADSDRGPCEEPKPANADTSCVVREN